MTLNRRVLAVRYNIAILSVSVNNAQPLLSTACDISLSYRGNRRASLAALAPLIAVMPPFSRSYRTQQSPFNNKPPLDSTINNVCADNIIAGRAFVYVFLPCFFSSACLTCLVAGSARYSRVV